MVLRIGHIECIILAILEILIVYKENIGNVGTNITGSTSYRIPQNLDIRK